MNLLFKHIVLTKTGQTVYEFTLSDLNYLDKTEVIYEYDEYYNIRIQKNIYTTYDEDGSYSVRTCTDNWETLENTDVTVYYDADGNIIEE